MESRVGRGGSSTSTALRAKYEYEYERESRPRSLADPYWLQSLWRRGRNRYRHRVAGLFDPDSDSDPDPEGILRTAFGVRRSFGMWTPGRPRSSANPGLSAATPSALGRGWPEMRVPSPWVSEGGTRTRTRTRADGIRGWSRELGVVVRVRVPPFGLSTSTSTNGNRGLVPWPTRIGCNAFGVRVGIGIGIESQGCSIPIPMAIPTPRGFCAPPSGCGDHLGCGPRVGLVPRPTRGYRLQRLRRWGVDGRKCGFLRRGCAKGVLVLEPIGAG
jgi:hypothetical protein